MPTFPTDVVMRTTALQKWREWLVCLLVLSVGLRPNLASAQTACDQQQLSAILTTVINRTNAVPASSRRVLIDALRSECPNFDETVAKTVGPSLTADLSRFPEMARRLGRLRLKVSDEDAFPNIGQPLLAGFDSVTPGLVDTLQMRVAQLRPSPVHLASELLAKAVLAKAGPALLDPAANLTEFAALPVDSREEIIGRYVTPSARDRIRGLGERERRQVIASLQTYAGDNVRPSSQPWDEQFAIGQVLALGKTIQHLDSDLEQSARTVQINANRIAQAVATLSNLASQAVPVSQSTSRAAAARAATAVYAGEALHLLASEPLRMLGAPSGPAADLLNLLGRDSQLAPVLSAARGVIADATSAVQAANTAFSGVSSVLDFARSAGLDGQVLDSATTALGSLVSDSLSSVLSSTTPFGAIAGIASVFGFGGPSEVEKLQAHLDKRLDAVDAQLGVANRKLDAILETQHQIITQLEELRAGLTTLDQTLRETRADVLSAIYKLRYENFYNREVTIDITMQQLNSCNAFLNPISDRQHQTYSAKAAFFTSPGVADLFTGCLNSLQQLVSFGRISDSDRIASVFQLEANPGRAGFRGVDEYLADVKPILSFYAERLTPCQANALAHPKKEIPASLDDCMGLDLQDQDATTREPTRTDPRVISVNDPWLKNNLDTLLNYKAVLGFADTVLGVTPYVALADPRAKNRRLVPFADLANAPVVDASVGKGLVREAIRYLDLAIAQQSVLAGNRVSVILTDDSPDLPDYLIKPATSSAASPTASPTPRGATPTKKVIDPIFVENAIRDAIARWSEGAFPGDGCGGGNKAALRTLMQDTNALTEDQLGSFSPGLEDICRSGVLSLPKVMFKDAQDPNTWYLMLGAPVHGNQHGHFGRQRVSPNELLILNRDHKKLLVSGEENRVCTTNPIEPFHKFSEYEIRNGTLIENTFSQPCRAGADFSRVAFVKISESFLTNQLTPTAEMLALISMRERLYWAAVEYEGVSEGELSADDLKLWGALEMVPATGRSAK